MTIKTISDSERDPSQSAEPAQSATDAAVDRLAGLLPAEALEDALKGLDPDEITGRGGVLTPPAGRGGGGAGARGGGGGGRGGAGGRADRASRAPAGRRGAGRQRPQRRRAQDRGD